MASRPGAEKKFAPVSIPARLGCRRMDGPSHGGVASPGDPHTMEATLDPILAAVPSASTRARWAGRVLSAVPTLFLTMDGVMKLIAPPPVVEASARIGVTQPMLGWIGAIELACLALYLVPRTAVLGAVLLTGYLGGAVALHVRMGDPLATHILSPVYVGVFFWAGLYLRDARVRAAVRALT